MASLHGAVYVGEWKDGQIYDAVGAVCVGLKVDINSYLPKEWYEACEEAAAFTAACLLRYKKLGRPLYGVPRSVILEGLARRMRAPVLNP